MRVTGQEVRGVISGTAWLDGVRRAAGGYCGTLTRGGKRGNPEGVRGVMGSSVVPG